MAIAYGDFVSYTAGTGGAGSFTGPAISGLNTYLLLGICMNAGGAPPIPTSVTYDSTSMTSLGTISADYNRVAVYGVINPGSQKAIAYSGSSGPNCAFAVYYTGVDQSTPVRTATTATSAASPATANVTNSQSGDLLIGFFGTNDISAIENSFPEASIGSGQTYRGNILSTSQSGANLALCEEGGASGTVTVSWGYVGAYSWSEVVVPLVPAAVGGTTSTPNDGPFYGPLRGSVR